MSPDEKTGDAPVRVGIVGGGLAGLAAASLLVERSAEVHLFEARRQLGGRAGSYCDPETGRMVDLCQHVGMGCCTYLLDFCRRMGIDGFFRRDRTLEFFGPNGGRHTFRAASGLPAPFHLLPALMRLKYLSLRERVSAARLLLRLAQQSVSDTEDGPTVGHWLRCQGQSDRAIERFWSVVLVSALGETIDRASLAAARKVFVYGFMSHREAYELLLPTAPLSELYDRRAADWLSRQGAIIRRDAPVARICGDAAGANGLQLADGSVHPFDHVIVAVPWRHLARLIPADFRDRLALLAGVELIESSPIAGVHLWFDQPITQLPHAVFVGRLSQWLFNHRLRPVSAQEPLLGHYCQVVISGARHLAGRPGREILAEVLDDLESCFGAAAGAKLLKWRIVTQPHAVFSVRPGIDALRPPQATSIAGLHLAGDWTQTGLPATMEGAIRSGYRAAECVLGNCDVEQQFRLGELPRGIMARFLLGTEMDPKNWTT